MQLSPDGRLKKLHWRGRAGTGNSDMRFKSNVERINGTSIRIYIYIYIYPLQRLCYDAVHVRV
jgi:hypothetical protein